MSTKIKLTEKQRTVYETIKKYYAEHGKAPTRLELTKLLGYKASNSVEEILKHLVQKGYIKSFNYARGLQIVNENEINIIKLPIIGNVAAGLPIDAIEHIESTLSIDCSLFMRKPDYLLRVRGESMINVGILDGDLIAIQKTTDIRNGQIVVARINNEEVTVKRFKRDGAIVYLIPENDSMQPIIVDLNKDKLDIDGIYVGLVRENATIA